MKLGWSGTWGNSLRRRGSIFHGVCALLCLCLVGAWLMSCRRQRTHSKTVEVTEVGGVEAAETAESSTVILDSEWISSEKPEHAFSGQLLLEVSTVLDSERERLLATLRIVFPDTHETVWTNLPVGTRKILEFEGAEYMVDFTEVTSYGARISIIKK